MAPMTRSAAQTPLELPTQVTREASWQFVGLESASVRELSDEPALSYDDNGDIPFEDHANSVVESIALGPLQSPDEREDILHPLREAANRVGREVERFAELLDGYNPLKAESHEERQETAMDLINVYWAVAKDTAQRLRNQHASEISTTNGRRGYLPGDDEEQDRMNVENIEESPEYSTRTDSKTTVADLKRWEQEEQTWDLLQRLLRLRFMSHSSKDGRIDPVQRHLHQYSSEQEIWRNFLNTDALALERKTVLQWLQDTADQSREDIDILVHGLQQNAERGDIIAHGWLHTKAAIKNQKRISACPRALSPEPMRQDGLALTSNNTELLVTQLDPDAPTRQGRKLEAQDDYFERAIWLGCYELLRRGRSASDVRDWCTERTEVWRAVSLSGIPDGDGMNSEDKETHGSPISSTLWRKMCFTLARKAGGNEFQSAVYGILSGDVPSVEAICKCWDDFVFVHYNALLKAQYDHYLQDLQSGDYPSASNFATFDAVQFHGDSETTAKRLLDTLKIDRRTRAETLQPMKMLQGVLIADQFKHFIYQQGLALSKFANAKGVSNLIPAKQEQPEDEETTRYIALDDHDSLRVLTHVLLIFKSLGVDLGGYAHEVEVENVIVAYISFLRLSGKEELIPLYSSQLSGARRYAVLSRNLIDVTDREQRVTQIKLMRELGLDVQEFVKMQARYLLDDFEDKVNGYPALGNFTLFEDVQTENGTVHKVRKDFFGDDSDVVDRVDMLLIRSMEWYLLVDGLWSETFTVGTILYLRFYKHMHLSAARLLASTISSTDIARTKTRAILGESTDFASLEVEHCEDLTEVLDGTADLKRQMKKYLLQEAKSFRELEVLTEHLDNIETVTSMASLMSEENAATWQKGWRQELAKAFVPTRLTGQYLFRGWLLSSQKAEIASEFNILREAYLPETLLAYISVLQFGGSALTRDFLLECMELCALIADEDCDLLPLFLKSNRMGDLVEAFASASKTLLLLTSAKQGPISRSKKMRVKGWKQDLWSPE